MSRTYVVTGAASGIGATTTTLLRQQGHTVIGVDIQQTDIVADLSTEAGRRQMIDEVTERSGGSIDAVLAIAGLSLGKPVTAKVNYFGAVATLEGLRPLMAKAEAPRAATVASIASLQPHDEKLVELLLSGDEEAATARAERLATDPATGFLIYSSSKQAVARWVRRNATQPEWAGQGIPLNAVGPGVILTPMSEPLLKTEEGRKLVADSVPMPLNGYAPPAAVAWPLIWLTSAENTHICGQVLFVDGGFDAVVRGDSTW